METSDFAQTWATLNTERQRLANRRNDLEAELSETRTKIRHMDEILNHLRPLSDMAWNDDEVVGLGITDAIRYVLRNSSERLSPQDVREQLTQKGYDLSDLTAPMGSIYKILTRLSEGDDSDVAREKEEGRVYYSWKVPPISDDDIPF